MKSSLHIGSGIYSFYVMELEKLRTKFVELEDKVAEFGLLF
jgi:hypothetical protein